MFKKSGIAIAVAGALFAAQAGANNTAPQSLRSDEFLDPHVAMSNHESSSGAQPASSIQSQSSRSDEFVDPHVAVSKQESSGVQLASSIQSQSSRSDEFVDRHVAMSKPEGSYSMRPAIAEDEAISWDESSGSQQISVFNPDGSSYSIVPVEMDIAMLEPALTVAATEALPDQVTVFEPAGWSYSYEFTPELTLLEPIDLIIVMDDESSSEPVALIDEDADLRPTYTAHYASPPSYTGILEETLS